MHGCSQLKLVAEGSQASLCGHCLPKWELLELVERGQSEFLEMKQRERELHAGPGTGETPVSGDRVTRSEKITTVDPPTVERHGFDVTKRPMTVGSHLQNDVKSGKQSEYYSQKTRQCWESDKRQVTTCSMPSAYHTNEVEEEDASTSFITTPLAVMETDQNNWSRLADQQGVTIQSLSEIELSQLTLQNGQPITLRFNCNLAEALPNTTLATDSTGSCQIQVLSENSSDQQNDSSAAEIIAERPTEAGQEVVNMGTTQQKNIDLSASLQNLLEMINYQQGSIRIELPPDLTADQNTQVQQGTGKTETDSSKPDTDKTAMTSEDGLFDKTLNTEMLPAQQAKFVSLLSGVNVDQKNLKESFARPLTVVDVEKLNVIGNTATVASDVPLTENLVHLPLKRSNDIDENLIQVSLENRSQLRVSPDSKRTAIKEEEMGDNSSLDGVISNAVPMSYCPEEESTVYHSQELYSQLLQEVVSHSLLLEKIMVFCKSSDLSIISQSERYDFSEKLEVLLRVIDHLKHLLEQDASTKMKCDKSTQTERKMTINSSTMCEIIIPSVSSVSGREIRQPGRFNPSTARLCHTIDYDDEAEVEVKRRNRRKRKITQRARQYVEESLPSTIPPDMLEKSSNNTHNATGSCTSDKSVSEPLGWTQSLLSHINLSSDTQSFYTGQEIPKKSLSMLDDSSQDEPSTNLNSTMSVARGSQSENSCRKVASGQVIDSTALNTPMENDGSEIPDLSTSELDGQLPVILINQDSSVVSVVPQNVLDSMQIEQAVSQDVSDTMVTVTNGNSRDTELNHDSTTQAPALSSPDDGVTDYLKEDTDQTNATIESNQSGMTRHSLRRVKASKTKKEYEAMAAFKFFCKKCSFKTKRHSHYQKHLKLHEKISEMYYCKYCDFKTIRNGTLRKHEVTHSQEVLKCQKCKYVTDNTMAMEKHNKLKHNNGMLVNQKRERTMMFQCKHCNHKSSTILQLQRHMRLHLRHGNSQAEEGVLPEISFECNLCKYKTKRKEHFVRHKNNVHSDHRPYLCDTCGRSFKRTDALAQHKLIHVEKANRKYSFICQTCNKGFRSKSHLQEHMAMHSSTRQFLCDICGAKFKTKSCQQKHVKSIHQNPRAFSCTVCDKRFNTSYALRRHEGTHERPYQKVVSSSNILMTQSYLNQNVTPVTTQTLAPQEFVQVQDIITPNIEESYDQSGDKLQQAFTSLQNENATAIMFLSSSLPASWT